MSNHNHAATAVPFQFVLIVAAVLALTGCALVIFGCAFEAQSQLDLLRTAGSAALDTYLAHVGSHQLTFGALMVESVTVHGYAYSALIQGVGIWFIFVLAPLSVVLLTAAHRSTSLRAAMAQ